MSAKIIFFLAVSFSACLFADILSEPLDAEDLYERESIVKDVLKKLSEDKKEIADVPSKHGQQYVPETNPELDSHPEDTQLGEPQIYPYEEAPPENPNPEMKGAQPQPAPTTKPTPKTNQ